MNRYRISTMDPGDDPEGEFCWRLRRVGMTLWELRGAIRDMRGEGYEYELSILVEREER